MSQVTNIFDQRNGYLPFWKLRGVKCFSLRILFLFSYIGFIIDLFAKLSRSMYPEQAQSKAPIHFLILFPHSKAFLSKIHHRCQSHLHHPIIEQSPQLSPSKLVCNTLGETTKKLFGRIQLEMTAAIKQYEKVRVRAFERLVT